MKEPVIKRLIKKVLQNLASTKELKQFESRLNYSNFNKMLSSDLKNNYAYFQGVRCVFEFGNMKSDIHFA